MEFSKYLPTIAINDQFCNLMSMLVHFSNQNDPKTVPNVVAVSILKMVLLWQNKTIPSVTQNQFDVAKNQ